MSDRFLWLLFWISYPIIVIIVSEPLSRVPHGPGDTTSIKVWIAGIKAGITSGVQWLRQVQAECQAWLYEWAVWVNLWLTQLWAEVVRLCAWWVRVQTDLQIQVSARGVRLLAWVERHYDALGLPAPDVLWAYVGPWVWALSLLLSLLVWTHSWFSLSWPWVRGSRPVDRSPIQEVVWALTGWFCCRREVRAWWRHCRHRCKIWAGACYTWFRLWYKVNPPAWLKPILRAVGSARRRFQKWVRWLQVQPIAERLVRLLIHLILRLLSRLGRLRAQWGARLWRWSRRIKKRWRKLRRRWYEAYRSWIRKKVRTRAHRARRSRHRRRRRQRQRELKAWLRDNPGTTKQDFERAYGVRKNWYNPRAPRQRPVPDHPRRPDQRRSRTHRSRAKLGRRLAKGG